MCVLLLKPFVLGYIAVAILLQLLIYFKKIVLIPRGMDYGVMAMFLVAFFMSQRFVLGGSMALRLIVLFVLGVLLYGASKILFPGQYKCLLKISNPEEIKVFLQEGEEYSEKKELFLLKKNSPSIERLKDYLVRGPRPLFELLMALLLGGVFLYFLLN
ncbi:MAG: hypothetical protein GX046_05020 [Tissierellia bacterium]|jgi:hypothetical protein|nr:hypothetical protein [Tissierellia bacterium]